MKVNLYSIYDQKSSMYGPIVSFANNDTAKRSFIEMITSGDRNSMLYLYPDDYILRIIGFFDTESGIVTPVALLHDVNKETDIISGPEAIEAASSLARLRKQRSEVLSGKNETPETTDFVSVNPSNC